MKPIIKFKKDIELDAKNWWKANNNISYGFDWSKNCPKHILKKIKNKKYSEVKDYLKKEITKYYGGYDFFKKDLNNYFKTKEDLIINRLEKIHNKKFPVRNVDIYYTSFMRCPYRLSKNRFWIQINEYHKKKDFLSLVITHELMHLFFLKYYWDFCESHSLKDNEIEDIKESFSVLLNVEFKDIFYSRDVGYTPHKKLRKYILKEWKKSKNFKKVLIKTINYYKKIK